MTTKEKLVTVFGKQSRNYRQNNEKSRDIAVLITGK